MSDAVAAAQARRIDIGIARADEGATVKGQSEALRMLLRNLLENAVKYTPEEGRVDIAIARLDDAVELSVDDSGPGLPPTERERVLDRFYRSGEPAGAGQRTRPLDRQVDRRAAWRERDARCLAEPGRGCAWWCAFPTRA